MSTTVAARETNTALTGTAGPNRRRPSLLHDTGTVFVRELLPVLRNPFSVVFTMVQPLVFLGLFGPLLSDFPGTGEGSALQWFVPGIVVMSCLFSGAFTGSNLLFELQTGSHERMLVTPLRRSALLIGRALKEIVPMVMQTVIIVAVCMPFGFELHLAGAALAVLILAVMAVGIGALSYSLALASKDQDWLFWTIQQTLLFPFLLLAGILLPLDNGPGWLRTLGDINPLTYVVDACRLLFNGEIAAAGVLQGAGAAAFLAALGLLVGIRSMRHST
ncbi:ABC transporter permease [Phytoactinopolyspora halotolerans]|uniref:Transport permease protein n=1 Tax=Phytoactinopolyspora halotolerans TaxID=1981512 RepID=A0A6L9S0W8_9ACTN|nr:ABC transporter permease [Phytoactinopolyspora halotolerans]NED98656.1 ABC transporter permease [Phytoactinopolyspora halotolerans]